MRKKLSNVAFFIFAITLLGVFAFSVRIGATADSVVVLRTTGITCGSCSSKISTALEALKGVAVTEVDAEGGWVVVGYDTKIVTPQAVAAQVTATGFDSTVRMVQTPEQFKQMTGRDLGRNTSRSGGCGGCGTKSGGCGSNKNS